MKIVCTPKKLKTKKKPSNFVEYSRVYTLISSSNIIQMQRQQTNRIKLLDILGEAENNH